MKIFLLSFLLIIVAISMIQSDLLAQSGLPDSLIFQGSQMDVGQTFRTGTATSFGHYTINAYFKEPNGTEHLAYVDNYELFYFKSTDNGVSWSKEKIITGHEGDIQNCALTVDTAGKVFIGLTIHSLYNYANPTGITGGSNYFLLDAYCVNNKTGSWVTELVYLHPSNYGPKVAGLFVDSSNNVHFIANYYGWYSNGGTAWEWVRNSNTNTWGTIKTIVQFTDGGLDRFIYDTYAVVPDQFGNVTLVMCRYYPTNLTRLFYVRYNGSTWSAPINITDTVAVAWNRFDALIDPAGHTYIAYLQNNAQGVPVLKVMKDFQPAQIASINLAPVDTIYYFRMHCNSSGLFTMFLTIKNQNVHTTFSNDAINWSDPIPTPDNLKNYMGGLIIRTDARQGYFTDYCKQIVGIAGPRTSQPYGPDTLFYGSIRILGVPSSPSLTTPPNSSVVDTSFVTFQWTAATPEVTHYWLEIDTTSEFNTSNIDSTITSNEFTYNELEAYKTYYWRVKAKNQRCWSQFSDVNSFNVAYLGIEDKFDIPKEFMLAQNHPNPFNPNTKIQFDLPFETYIKLKVFNILGEEVATLIEGKQNAGYKNVEFNAARLTSGVYFYRLETPYFSQTKKLILLK
ncbi:MAG: T9SS type A sorting domain-containing protein [Ignavibacteriales bacterium]|nr:T9SS type A sorting domain-containing protein [Ignavibacteriales bacterium]